MSFHDRRRREAEEAKAREAEHKKLKAAHAKLRAKLKLVHVQVRPILSIFPAPENNDVYDPITADDPKIRELYHSIQEIGVQEPITITTDDYIISGHRRHFAAKLAELDTVPVKVYPISRSKNPDEFRRLLVMMNSQRIKSNANLLHEELIRTDSKEAYQQIKNQRLEKDFSRGANLTSITPDDIGQRDAISKAKRPLLQAIQQVLEEQSDYWPLSVRQIHYRLLNIKPPLHASKPKKYGNDKASYRAAIDICARGRVARLIPWEAIDDATRPVELNRAFWNPASFFKQELENFLSGYWRNRQQSQPFHIEIVAEKLTVQSILRDVAREYTMPLTISRGMNTLSPKKAIVDRYRRSNKQGLKLLVVTDLDPAGDTIAEDLVKSFRRDFEIDEDEIEAFKVALTFDQIGEFQLEPSMDAKKKSPTYKAYVKKYGITDAYELEAMDPGDLIEVLNEAIKDVIDIDLYNQELAAEEKDSAEIIAVQKKAREYMKSLGVIEPKTPAEAKPAHGQVPTNPSKGLE